MSMQKAVRSWQKGSFSGRPFRTVLPAAHCSLSTRGFTLLEILVAIGIMALISWVLFLGFSVWSTSRILDSGAEEVRSALREARSQTLASVGGTSYGVHFTATGTTIFTGTTYSAAATTNRVAGLHPRLILVASLEGGASDVTFERQTGKSSVTGTIAVSLAADASKSRIITVLPSGLAE